MKESFWRPIIDSKRRIKFHKKEVRKERIFLKAKFTELYDWMAYTSSENEYWRGLKHS